MATQPTKKMDEHELTMMVAGHNIDFNTLQAFQKQNFFSGRKVKSTVDENQNELESGKKAGLK